MSKLQYSTEYYHEIANSSERSARAMLPFLFELFAPRSFLEIGSGTGVWTRAAVDIGVKDYCAVDGPWISENDLVIAREHFVKHDLTKPLDLGRKFDLAISLEVAEHLPAHAADTILQSLTRHTDAVLFGAAV